MFVTFGNENNKLLQTLLTYFSQCSFSFLRKISCILSSHIKLSYRIEDDEHACDWEKKNLELRKRGRSFSSGRIALRFSGPISLFKRFGNFLPKDEL